MLETHDTNNQQPSETSSLLHKLFWNFIIPAGIVLVGLIIEYKSGLFQRAAQSDSLSSLYYYCALCIAVTLVATALFAKDSLLIWLRQHRYIREQFAFLILCTLTLLTIVVAVSMVSGLMPWSIHNLLIQAIRGENIARPEARWTDYFLLLSLYIMIIGSFNRQHQRWYGLKSIEQYQREEHSESINFFAEGASELRRLLKREPPLQVYSESSHKHFIPQLEPVTDSLVWKDQAKELVRLSSSSYAFDTDSGWHDKENCWVGQNVNTGDLVFLYPYQGEISEDEFKMFLEYTKRIAKSENKGIGEIIAASKRETFKPIELWEGLFIRYETETSLLDCLVDFKDYFNEIRRRVLVNYLPDSNLTLHDVYVPSQFFLPDGAEHNDSIENYLNDWLNEAGQRQLALLGGYGQGKSTTALMWTYHLINKDIKLHGHIPLLVELRGTSPRNLAPLQLLGAWAAQYNINPQALMRLHIAGRLVLIFEGFDEMALVGDAEMRLKHFRTLWQFAYPKAKILITGRPNFFLDEEEMKAALGISKQVAARPFCEALRLSLFKPDQIKEALRAYKVTVQEQIHALVKRNSRFLELVSRPSLLHIVAVLWERERLFEKVDQLTSAYVMDLFIRHSYRRQGLKELDSSEFMALTTLEREYFMTGIAAYMAAKGLPNQITGTQLSEVITNLIEAIPEAVSTESSAISGETTQPLRRRIKGTEYGAEHVKTDVRACGLLIDDPATPGTFRFGHKSFMEYLFASVVAEHIQKVKSEKARGVMKATNAQIEDILLLPVAIDFLSELLVGTRDGTEEEQEAKELPTASRLFRTIIIENAPQLIYMRPAVFIEVIIYSLSRNISFSRRILVRMLPMITAMLFFPIVTFWQMGNLFEKSEDVIHKQSTFSLLITIVSMILFSLSMFVFFSTTVVRRKLRLWNHICRKIGIQHKTLHKVTGTSLVPWVREQPFDYYNYHLGETTPDAKHGPQANGAT